MRSSSRCSPKRQSSTRSACSVKSAKFVPAPSHVGPSGNGVPVQTCRVDIRGTVPTADDAVRDIGDDLRVIGDELGRLMTWSDHHKRLFIRLALVLVLTA